MDRIVLDGDWTLTRERSGDRYPARVPGCVHTDLMRAGVLPELDHGDNELQHQWPVDEDWRYERSFELSPNDCAAEGLILRCAGIDTLAELMINGETVLRPDNMFRTWEVDLTGRLRAGTNTIALRFPSIVPTMQAKDREHHLPAWNLFDQRFAGKSHLRKMACAFGWDWGPKAATCGIWRTLELLVLHGARLADCLVEQEHGTQGVELALCQEFDGDPAGTTVQVVLEDPDGAVIGEIQLEPNAGAARGRLAIPEPELWWPNGMGAQPLYHLRIVLHDDDGQTLDSSTRRIGLRTIALERTADAWGENFQFVVNGRPVFMKGACWVPADYYLPRLERADYARLLGDAAAAHMNMIRLWGGGIYEDDTFYELCDEYGLLIWHDFMFACSTYPTGDPVWLESVRHEVADNVRRVRHHAAIALWCGNNELEQGLVHHTGWNERAMSWADYSRLFDVHLPDWLAELDPTRDYWPCSPHTPHGDRYNHYDPSCGDAHTWDVWFGGRPFEAQRELTHRFISEIGFQSFPEPRTFDAYTDPDERNLTSYTSDLHQRSRDGNRKIFTYLLDWYRVPADLPRTLWATQATQALCLKFAVEHARRLQPRMMGLLYWQLNDIWPCASWAGIDVHGRWKALHHHARRFFAPLLVSILEDSDAGSASIHCSNHLPQDQEVTVDWQVTDTAGAQLASGCETLGCPSQSDRVVCSVDCAAQLERHGPRRLLVWATARVDGMVCSRNCASFERPKHLALQPVAISPTFAPTTEPGIWRICLQADAPALSVRLELVDLDCRFSDNFFDLPPGEVITIEAHPANALERDELRRRLRVSHLALDS
ncbi:MAG: beta-mannosidase [Planctomycetota bacterium]